MIKMSTIELLTLFGFIKGLSETKNSKWVRRVLRLICKSLDKTIYIGPSLLDWPCPPIYDVGTGFELLEKFQQSFSELYYRRKAKRAHNRTLTK